MPSEVFDPTRRSATAVHTVRGVLFDDKGKAWMYVQAAGSISVGQVCRVDRNGQCDTMTTAEADGHVGGTVGVAQVAFTDNQWGFVQVYGQCNSISVATVAVGVQLYTTTTSGRLDDTASDGPIVGINTIASTGNNVVAGMLNWPTVSDTQ